MPRTKTSTQKMTEVSMIASVYGKEYLPGSHIGDAFNWYRYSCDDSQAKKFLLDYFEHIEDTMSYDIYKSVDSKLIYAYASTACWMARMSTIGFFFEKDQMVNFQIYLKRILEKRDEIENAKKIEISRPKHNPLASKILENCHTALNEILDAINLIKPKIKDPTFSTEGILKKYSVHKHYKNFFIGELKEVLAELELVLSKTDQELYEQYTVKIGYSPLMLKRKRDFVINVIYYAENYFSKITPKQKITDTVTLDGNTKQIIATVEKKPRKPRKKKVISAEKRISRLQYLKAYPELKLVSVAPIGLLGASEAWLFNTRYSQLQVYRAKSESGLDVKGTTLLNFDESKSTTKRIGRHADTITANVLKAGKVVLRRTMDEIKSTGTECNGRLGEYTIILRIIK